MAPTDFLLLIPVGLLVGVLLGCIGIGGVLLVPALAFGLGVELHIAIASCMMSYLLSGLVGAFSYARRGSIRWATCGWLAAGAMPGAFAGAALVTSVPPLALEVLLTTLICFSGAQAMRQHADLKVSGRELSGQALLAIGLVTGLGSAMSGTGGP